MNSVKSECMALKQCIVCRKAIEIGENMIKVHEDGETELWVHEVNCYYNFFSALNNKEEIERGMIIGLCDICLKPVRTKDRFIVIRTLHESRSRFSTSFTQLSKSDVTIPRKSDISFEHTKCAEPPEDGTLKVVFD